PSNSPCRVARNATAGGVSISSYRSPSRPVISTSADVFMSSRYACQRCWSAERVTRSPPPASDASPSAGQEFADPVRADGQQQGRQPRPGVPADQQLVQQGEERALSGLQLGCGCDVGWQAQLLLGHAVH